MRCTLCPHLCQLGDGEVGRCHVRRNTGGRPETATWATSVRHVQPIERKPFYHFRPGLRVLTIAAPGCSFACHYCQNYRISQFGRDAQVEWTASPVSAEELANTAMSQQCALGMSYSEPSLAAELTLELGRLARPAGVDLVWKTNGFVTEDAARRLLPCLSAVNVDLKAPDELRHSRLTGASLQPVLDFLRLVLCENVWLEVSTPIIPDFNDDPTSLQMMADQIVRLGNNVPWHLLRFTPEYHLSGLKPTHPDQLAFAREIGRAAGLNYVYVERALGSEGRSTRCPSCDTRLVARDIYEVREFHLVDGACPVCGSKIAGCWER